MEDLRPKKQKQRTLVSVSDSEILINFALNTKCRANLRVRSLCATGPVAFKVQTSSPHKFLVNPPSGLVQPNSHATLQIVLKPQNQIPVTYPRSPSDRFLIKTAESFDSLVSESTQDVKLKVAFVGPYLLKHAVSCGDLNAVKNIIKRQRSIVVDLSKDEAESLYRIAAELADAGTMVVFLLQAGLNLDGRMKLKTEEANRFYQGWSELHVAVAFDRTDEVLSLLKEEKYNSLDCKDKEGKTALHLAVSKGNLKCAQALVEYGADKDSKCNDGRSALHIAVTNSDRRMVEMLVEMGADPTVRDNRGRSCFDIARDKCHVSK